MSANHCACVVSVFAIQKPRVRVTSCWTSSSRRPASVAGLPIMNVPGGHQQKVIRTPFPRSNTLSFAFVPNHPSFHAVPSRRIPTTIPTSAVAIRVLRTLPAHGTLALPIPVTPPTFRYDSDSSTVALSSGLWFSEEAAPLLGLPPASPDSLLAP